MCQQVKKMPPRSQGCRGVWSPEVKVVTTTKVLVVDDSLTMRKMISRLLLDMGFDSIVQAVDGQDALSKCYNHTDIGLILSD